MKKIAQILLTTALGGAVFLLPLVVVVALVGKALKIMMVIAKPLDKLIPYDSVGEVALLNILAVVATLVTCLLAGVAAKSSLGAATVKLIDTKFLEVLPGYAFIRGMAGGIIEGADGPLKPVLARLDDAAHIAFEVEREDGIVTVYLPGAPNPYTGTVAHMTEDRIEPLDLKFNAAIKKIRSLGKGSSRIVVGPLTRGRDETDH